jgi:hypothetical protein
MNATKEIGQSHDIYRILSALTPGNLMREDYNLLEPVLAIILDLFDSMPEGVPERDMPYVELRNALDQFLRRTLESEAVIESVKIRRLDMYLKIIKVIYGPDRVRSTLLHIPRGNLGQLPPSMEIAYTLSRWCAAYKDMGHMVTIAPYWLVDTLIHVPKWERDGCWIAFVKEQFDSSNDLLLSDALTSRDSDSVVLAILMHVLRRAIYTDSRDREREDMMRLLSRSEFDILVCNTLPGLQNEFCALWNNIVQEAHRNDRDSDSYCVKVLRWIRQLYIALHQGTSSAPTEFDT